MRNIDTWQVLQGLKHFRNEEITEPAPKELISEAFICLTEAIKSYHPEGEGIRWCEWELCRASFIPKSSKQRFCSNRCRQAQYRRDSRI